MSTMKCNHEFQVNYEKYMRRGNLSELYLSNGNFLLLWRNKISTIEELKKQIDLPNFIYKRGLGPKKFAEMKEKLALYYIK